MESDPEACGALADYKLVRRIAEGRFGSVVEAQALSTGQRVAIKRIYARRPPPGYAEDPWSKSGAREVEVLSRVRHENVVKLLEHVITTGSCTVLVYEFLAWNLAAALKRLLPLVEEELRLLLRMLFSGLAFLHGQRVVHRDLKPNNLLLDGETGMLKIADFGSSRFLPEEGHRDAREALLEPVGADEGLGELPGQMTRDVCTRWYKCPEMLFGSVDYGLPVDLWAAGCLACELLSPSGSPLFPGNSDLEQLCLIFQGRGTPREADWPELRHLPDYSKVEFKAREPVPFAFEADRSASAVALAEGLLQLPPQRRTTAAEALQLTFLAPEEPAASLEELLARLGEPPIEQPETPSQLSPLDGYGSEDSLGGFLGDGDFEPVPIETTTCGLWDEVGLRKTAGQEASGHNTPPPPSGGQHVFKQR